MQQRVNLPDPSRSREAAHRARAALPLISLPRKAARRELDPQYALSDDYEEQPVEQAGQHPRVMRRRIEPLVAEQRLDHADVELALQQMGRKAVPQGVKRRAGLDLGGLGGEMKDAVELARRQRVDCITQRSLRPLRITIWALSMSQTLSDTTSEARRPHP
jgi:hypothetical protein